MRLALLLVLTVAPSAAEASDVALLFAGGAREGRVLHRALAAELRGAGLSLMNDGATQTAVRSLLGRSLERASNPQLQELRRQLGATHLVIVRPLGARRKQRLFQIRIFAENENARTMIEEVPKRAATRSLARFIRERLPRLRIEPAPNSPEQRQRQPRPDRPTTA